MPWRFYTTAGEEKVAPISVPPTFNEGTLPILPNAVYPDGFLAYLNTTGSNTIWTLRASGSGWYAMGGAFITTGILTPAAIPSGTGWRQSAAALTLPLSGVWIVQGSSDMIYGAVENIGGIGVGGQNYAATAAPPIIVTAGQGTANYRVGVSTPRTRLSVTVGTNEQLSLRYNTSNANAITPARAQINAEPVSLSGVV